MRYYMSACLSSLQVSPGVNPNTALVSITMAHSQDYWQGFKAGRDDGSILSATVTGISKFNISDIRIFNECTASDELLFLSKLPHWLEK
jgi:hypothetical protein